MHTEALHSRLLGVVGHQQGTASLLPMSEDPPLLLPPELHLSALPDPRPPHCRRVLPQPSSVPGKRVGSPPWTPASTCHGTAVKEVSALQEEPGGAARWTPRRVPGVAPCAGVCASAERPVPDVSCGREGHVGTGVPRLLSPSPEQVTATCRCLRLNVSNLKGRHPPQPLPPRHLGTAVPPAGPAGAQGRFPRPQEPSPP